MVVVSGPRALYSHRTFAVAAGAVADEIAPKIIPIANDCVPSPVRIIHSVPVSRETSTNAPIPWESRIVKN